MSLLCDFPDYGTTVSFSFHTNSSSSYFFSCFSFIIVFLYLSSVHPVYDNKYLTKRYVFLPFTFDLEQKRKLKNSVIKVKLNSLRSSRTLITSNVNLHLYLDEHYFSFHTHYLELSYHRRHRVESDSRNKVLLH